MNNSALGKILLVGMLLIVATGCGNNEKETSQLEVTAQTDTVVKDAVIKAEQEKETEVSSSFEPIKTVIYFKFDARDISTEEAEKLSKIIDILAQRKNLQIIIEGHTDPIGDREYNLQLSRQRANAVQQHLVERGVDNSVFKLVSHGAKQPTATNSYSHHRRVELTVVELPPDARFTE